MDHRLTVIMQALKNLAQDKPKFREKEHIAAQTSSKRDRTSVESPQVRTRTSVESPKEQQESGYQVSDDNLTENSSDTRYYDISDEEKFQEESIIPDQQNLMEGVQELCSGNQADPNIGSEVFLENISHEIFLMKFLFRES